MLILRKKEKKPSDGFDKQGKAIRPEEKPAGTSNLDLISAKEDKILRDKLGSKYLEYKYEA